MHAEVVDEYTRSVRAYPITMKRLEAYVAAVRELRAAGEKDPALLARLRAPRPAGEELPGMAARLDAIAPLKAILERHGLASIDLVLMPQAVLLGRTASALELEGRPMPPDQVNAAATALYRDHLEKMDVLVKSFQADLQFISGR